MRIDHAGAFPRPTAARVLWLGVREEREDLLADLHARVVAAVGEAEPDLPALDLVRSRPWRPHVTVARPRAGALRTPGGFLGHDPGVVWEPTEAALLASVPAGEGTPPRYLPRARFPLAANSGD